MSDGTHLTTIVRERAALAVIDGMRVSTVAAAVEEAFESKEDIVCIAGSFFTVGEAMEYLNLDPYKQ